MQGASTKAQTLGSYRITSDALGVVVTRGEPGDMDALAGRLSFDIAPSSGDPLVINPGPPKSGRGGAVEFEATVGGRFAVVIRLRFMFDSDSISASVEVANNGDDEQIRVSAYFELTGDADPEWLIPGLFYNENRPRDGDILFPGYSEIQRDASRFLSNHWIFRSDRSALPCVFCQTFRSAGYIAIDEFVNKSKERPSGIGPTGLGLRTHDGQPVMSVHAPYVEEPVKFSFCTEDGVAAEDTFAPLEKGETFAFNLSLALVPGGPGVREELYRKVYEQRWVHHPLKPKLGSMDAERIAIEGLVRWHLDSDHSFIHEKTPARRLDRQREPGQDVQPGEMHTGWLSGVFPAFVLLWHGRDSTNPEYVRSAIDVIDRISSELSPCGTLYPLFTEEDGPVAGLGPGDTLAHSRTVAEATLFLIRALRLEIGANTPHPLWYSAIISTLNTIASIQRDDGAFPLYWDLETGAPSGFEGTAGLCWIAAFAACDHWFHSRSYREAARKAAEHYAPMIEEGFLHGAIEDQPSVPSADDYHWAFLAYFLLYECDRDPRWLELARRAADLALTWRMGVNIQFPASSMLATAGFQTRGADVISAAMPVLAPFGLVTFGEMRKLSAMTGDNYYERRALESRTFASHLLASVDGQFNARRGQCISLVGNTDWRAPKGMVLQTGHAMTNALIEYAELLERHLAISKEAIEGEEEFVREASSRTSVVAIQRDLVLPESAASRRTQELLRRRASEQEVDSPSDYEIRFVGHGARAKGRVASGGAGATPLPTAGRKEGLPSTAPVKKPLKSRHTPLPDDYDPRSDASQFDLGMASESAGGKRKDILANLMDESDDAYDDRKTPSRHLASQFDSEKDEEETHRNGGSGSDRRYSSEDLERMLEDAERRRRETREVEMQRALESHDESSTENIEVKWKIF